jgi:hypothetical protein
MHTQGTRTYLELELVDVHVGDHAVETLELERAALVVGPQVGSLTKNLAVVGRQKLLRTLAAHQVLLVSAASTTMWSERKVAEEGRHVTIFVASGESDVMRRRPKERLPAGPATPLACEQSHSALAALGATTPA